MRIGKLMTATAFAAGTLLATSGSLNAATLVAHWDFENGGNDVVGSNHLTLWNNASVVFDADLGSNVLQVDDSVLGVATVAVGAGNVLNIPESGQFSVEMWVKSDPRGDSVTGTNNYTNRHARIIAMVNEDGSEGYNVRFANFSTPTGGSGPNMHVGGHAGFGIGVLRDDDWNVDLIPSAGVEGDPLPPSWQEWRHTIVAVDLNLGMTWVYVDGVLWATERTTSGSLMSSPLGGNGSFAIGQGDGATAHFSGRVDDVKFYHGIVPEPASMALLAIGGCLLLSRRRR